LIFVLVFGIYSVPRLLKGHINFSEIRKELVVIKEDVKDFFEEKRPGEEKKIGETTPTKIRFARGHSIISRWYDEEKHRNCMLTLGPKVPGQTDQYYEWYLKDGKWVPHLTQEEE